MKKTKILSTIFITTFILSLLAVAPVNAVTTGDEVSTGKFGNALDFDGDDDYVIVPDSDCLDISTFTLEAWIYPRSIPNTWPRIIHKGNYEFDLSNDVGDNGLAVNIGIPDTAFYSETNIITFNEWQHVAVTCDGTEVVFYRNNIKVGTHAFSSTADPDSLPLTIGNRFPDLERDFDGLIDEVRISNYVRTSFNLNQAPINDPGTVGLWHFDEGVGTTAFDAAFDEKSCKDDGTIVGASWVTEGFTLFFEGSAPDAIIRIIDDDNDLPDCIPPTPDGITQYFDVQIIGTFEGTVTVAVNYEDIDDDVIESTYSLYMADCVDFNDDGTVNGKDLSLIQKAIKNEATKDTETPGGFRYDVNNDGVVDESDVAIVKYYMSHGLIVNEDLYDVEEQARLPWIDITTWVDTENNIIYGETDHFSIFRCR